MKKSGCALLSVLFLGFMLPGAAGIAQARDVKFCLPDEIFGGHDVSQRGEFAYAGYYTARGSYDSQDGSDGMILSAIPVPEPSAWVLLGVAIGGAVVMALRRKIVSGDGRSGKRKDT